ncbi:MAG: hypothetical protein P8L77_04770 [Gammaproteobacteria bacterium]|nr:hypothetical protein [Gammaproteobacteria bacterium]
MFHSASHEVSHDVNSDTKAVDKSVDNAPKAISSTGNNVAKNTDRGIAETSENMSKFGKGSVNFSEHPIPATKSGTSSGAKTFMTKDGGDGTVTYAGNQDSQDPEAGTNTVKWGDSSQGKATMTKDAMSAGACAEQVGLSAVPVADQVSDGSTIEQDITQKNYAEEHPCANIDLATGAIS